MQVTVRSAIGDANGAIDQMPHLRRRRSHVHVLVRDILEERNEIDFLLVIAAQRGARLLAHDRDDRLVIHFCVVEAVEKMDRARTGGGQANAQFAGELGVSAGHECRHLFVSHLHVIDRIVRRDRLRR